MKILARGWRWIRPVLLVLAALILFIEDFGWKPLSAWLGRIARWPPLRRLEARVQRLPARQALVLFLIPALLLFPLKLVAVALIEDGHAIGGLGLIVAAKLLGTAVVG